MRTELLNKINEKYAVKRPEINIGDTVVVDTIIREGNKKRIQKFKGIIIAINGSGISKTFTIRKISYGVGVEKILPFNSPNIAGIEVLKHAKIRRSKLYYLRDRIGKAATYLKQGKKLSKKGIAEPEVIEEGIEESPEDVEPVTAEVTAEVEKTTETTTDAKAEDVEKASE